jgi:PIN domain nuclease of toxin-antitoxin system
VGNYLLDTHTAIWFLNGERALSQTARQIIVESSNRRCISIVSVWELAIKIGIGKMKFPGNSAGFIRVAEASGFFIVPIKIDYPIIVENLPRIHRDPFDRILIATAIVEKMTIITADKDIARYDVPHIW